VPLFTGNANMTGYFDINNSLESLNPNQQVFLENAEIIIALANQRGIRAIDNATWNNRNIDFQSGRRLNIDNSFNSGIFGTVAANRNAQNHFNINILIQGGKALQMSPIGKETKVIMQSDWASPSFQGYYLPTNRTIEANGFDAQWQISHLSRNIPSHWFNNNRVDISSSLFGVNFFKSDTYSLSTRAVKYALLFIIVPFLTLFLAEILLRRSIHPAQYILAGIGNVIFYLLLLSISELIAFHLAYLISATAVGTMMTLYSRSLFGAWSKTPFMAAAMFLCYIFLYFALQSDWALLIGSIGAFIVTGVIMFLTRKLNWSADADGN
jgi:inner membrane protein